MTCLQVSLPNLEVLGVDNLENLERLGHGPLSLGSLVKLRDFSVRGCGKLLCVFPSQLVLMLRNLEELTVERCNFLEVVFELEGVDCNEPNPELLSPLKVVKLRDLPKLNYISKRDPMDFKYIQTLVIEGCDSLRYVFAPTVTKSIPQLRELKIQRCMMLSRIVAEENGLGDSSVDEVEFPQLESLGLCELPNLVSFFPNVNATLAKSTDQLHNTMQPQPLFNGKVAFPRLEKLYLEGLQNLSDLWCSEVSLPNLEVLEVSKLENLERLGTLSVGTLFKLRRFSVRDCGKLLCVFPSQLVSRLGILEELTVQRCNLLEVVFELEGVDCNEPNPELLSPLKVVKLRDLPKLNYISKRDPIGFKYIQTLEIKGCDSLRYVFAPTVAKSISQLRELKIQRCKTLSRIVAEENGLGDSSVDGVEFPQLESLELCDLPNFMSFFPNVNTTLPESTDRLHNPMQPQSLFNEKVAIRSLKYVKLLGLENVSDLWCSELLSSSFSKLEKLEVSNCTSLRNMFHPSMAGCLVNLKELLIEDFSTLEAVVGKEEEVGEHGIKMDKTMFPQLGKLHLRSLPNLRMFCQFTYPLELPLLSKMVIVLCPSMDVFSLGKVSTPNLSLSSLLGYGDLINAKQLLREARHQYWGSENRGDSGQELNKNGDDPMARSMEKPRTLDYVTDKSISWQVAETQCRLVAIPERIDGPHKVARLLYTNSGDGVLALGCNGSIRLWKWGSSKHNPSGKKRLLNSVRLVSKATASVVPQQWQPASGLAMTNDVTGAKLEEAVPCIALSKDDSFVISACGGVISLFDMRTFQVRKMFKPPPLASTFLSFDPQDNRVIAIGMEDSTIHIYKFWLNEVKSILEGHQKRITGLDFSTNLNILVSSGADAQLCIWSIDTWKKLKSVPIQLPAGKARNGDTRVQFHSNQIYLLVSHETQLAIYDPSRDRIRQRVSQDVLPAPISSATYSCDSQLVYTSFYDGSIGVFDADNLTLRCRIAASAYLSPALLSGNQAVYPFVVAAHPQLPNQFAIALTDGSVIVMEPPTITGQDSGTTSSSNASNQTPDQKGEDVDVDDDLDKDVDEDALIMTRTRTATTSTHDEEEDLEEVRHYIHSSF
ncbi:hypothetical protein Vadar_019801 [Vaccinium darrowii]|uniref:Uncharacterized protein n=1 Tax=Vaccinium darrowii TaxID=229202 RepID=A0ACB7YMZ0_9ERIC|nr:hypothetical protein Vadar_019801 [Vaccinium darrowii]